MNSAESVAYIALARKWRPGQFADIVGQGSVVKTLMNAIRTQRIHHAYLFTGSRGIGKTSIARIFAKALRCQNPSEAPGKRFGAEQASLAEQSNESWLTSCDACPACLEITRGNSVDVIEIDGASNNGVDAVREIRESAKYLPSSGSRKIYIVDEVHMLTTAAFNAMLKTLEEPPAHVLFIFATTEPHKIPATILSRCQHFDYRRVSVTQIQQRLAEVTLAEGIEAEPGALALLARAAEGSMRDAMSLLDQVISFSGRKLTVNSTRESIGLLQSEAVLALLEAVLARKPLDALARVQQTHQAGHDLKVLTRTLLEILHGCILASVGASLGALGAEFSPEEEAEIQRIAQLRPLEEMELIFQVLHQGVEWVAKSPQPKIVLDVLVIKCATAEALAQVQTAQFGAAIAAPTAQAPAPQQVAAPTPVQASAPAVVQPAAPTPRAAPTWEGFIQFVRGARPMLASIMEHGQGEPGADVLVIAFNPADSYFKEQLQSRAYVEPLNALAREYWARPIRVQIESRAVGESVALRREREQRDHEAAIRKGAANHPTLLEAKSLFGAELAPIELIQSEGGGPHAPLE